MIPQFHTSSYDYTYHVYQILGVVVQRPNWQILTLQVLKNQVLSLGFLLYTLRLRGLGLSQFL